MEPGVRTGGCWGGGISHHVDPLPSRLYMLRGLMSHLIVEQEAAAADVTLTDRNTEA